MNELLNKYLDILKTGRLSEKQITAFRSVLAGTRGNLTTDELFILREAFYNLMPVAGYKLHVQQSVKAKNFLKQWCYCINGETRKQAREHLGLRELYAINDSEYFTLSDLYTPNANTGASLPVYSLWTKDGHGFDYYYNGIINVVG